MRYVNGGAHSRALKHTGSEREPIGVAATSHLKSPTVSFDRLDAPTAAKLSAIRTRFKLPVEEVDLLIQSGADEILSNPIFSRGNAGRR
jgi:hypothetical protein